MKPLYQLRFLVLVAAASIATGCGGAREVVRVDTTFEMPDGLPPIVVRVALQPEHTPYTARYTDAVAFSLRHLTTRAWFSPRPDLTLVDPPMHGTVAAPQGIVLARVPLWTLPPAMVPELAVARAMTRDAIGRAVDTSGLPPWFVEALVEHIARRITQALFQRDNNSPGFAMLEPRPFGGFIPRRSWLRLREDRDLPPITAFRSNPRASPEGAAATGIEALTGKTLATLATMERWIGRPACDAVIDEFIGAAGHQHPTIARFIDIASAVSGQDLSWLLVQTLGMPTVFDYAVVDLVSETGGSGSFETSVTIARIGDAMFTGSSKPRTGDFESGRGVIVAVAFENGEEVRSVWDGREDRKVFRFRSAARALSAVVDPDRTIALDMKRTNNGRALHSAAPTAAARWSARWTVWLEHLLLGYAALV